MNSISGVAAFGVMLCALDATGKNAIAMVISNDLIMFLFFFFFLFIIVIVIVHSSGVGATVRSDGTARGDTKHILVHSLEETQLLEAPPEVREEAKPTTERKVG